MPFGIGMGELMVILVVAVVLFGSRLPEVARNLGASYQQFRKGLYEIQSTITSDLDTETRNRKVTYRDYTNDYDAPPTSKFTPPPSDEPEKP
jgi:sec-independent protein translocase protein TatA